MLWEQDERRSPHLPLLGSARGVWGRGVTEPVEANRGADGCEEVVLGTAKTSTLYLYIFQAKCMMIRLLARFLEAVIMKEREEERGETIAARGRTG